MEQHMEIASTHHAHRDALVLTAFRALPSDVLPEALQERAPASLAGYLNGTYREKPWDNLKMRYLKPALQALLTVALLVGLAVYGNHLSNQAGHPFAPGLLGALAVVLAALTLAVLASLGAALVAAHQEAQGARQGRLLAEALAVTPTPLGRTVAQLQRRRGDPSQEQAVAQVSALCLRAQELLRGEGTAAPEAATQTQKRPTSR